MTEHVHINAHSSVKLTGSTTVYIDPYLVETESHDADYICITHAHGDHFSPESIDKVIKEDTTLIFPRSMQEKGEQYPNHAKCYLQPGESVRFDDLLIETVPSYNTNKPNHPKENKWVGYIVTLDGVRYYFCGDTDDIPEGRAVQCDVCLVPVGGTYTMDAREAAAFINAMKPKAAVPMHYGSVVGGPQAAEEFKAFVDAGITVDFRMGK